MSDNNLNNEPKNKLPKREQSNGNKNTIWIFIAIGVGFLILQFISMKENLVQIDNTRFESQLMTSGDVKKVVVVNKERVEVFLKEESLSKPEYADDLKKVNSGAVMTGESAQFFFTIGDAGDFSEQLRDRFEKNPDIEPFPVSYETRTDFMREVWGWILPLAIIIAVWIFIFRRMGGGAGGMFSIGKSRAKLFDNEKTQIKINFNHVAGLEEAKIEIQEIVDFLKNAEKYTKLGGKIPKGALLVGPPGTGKTLLAKAVAGEAKVPFFSMSGSDFVEMFVGVGASRVRDLFTQAKAKAPCIIFIDEIDAIGRMRSRGMSMGSNDERESTLNQLLTEMDGFDTNNGVIILAATNRADVLDPALLRAGRFDRQIHVELPDLTEREEIFKVHLAPLTKAEDLDIGELAKQTPGFSGADIANVCNEAALIAARRERETVGKQDFLDAVDRIIGGLEKKSKIITKSEKRTIAYHEAGHATVSWKLEHAHPLIKVTIVPRGQALGAAWYQPQERQITTREQLLDEMCAILGGRASEEINFHKISTGALNDLERVTKQAYALISYYGMSDKIGNISFFDSEGRSEYSFQKPFSEKTAELIDSEVKALIDAQYERAKQILSDNKAGMIELAELLLEREVIFTDDLEKIFGKREYDGEYEDEVKRIRNQQVERMKERERIKLEDEEKANNEEEDNSYKKKK